MTQAAEYFKWWQSGVIYQVYPRSFKDAGGNGTGDLKGITEKLDYLQWLGVSALWVSPVYPSPMDDFGYDITDYTGIEPLFGNMQDFDELLQKVHEKGMRLIFDLVPNHTSYKHPWFQEARSSKDNPKRDWYIWKDPKPGGGPPNNWQSVFGGSGWEYDAQTEQYYYHAFLKEQPDLNWRNPEVKRAMFDVMRFWLDKGIDGFRVDVIWHMVKDDLFRDNPPNPDFKEGAPDYTRYLTAYSEDQPLVHDIIAEMRELMDSYGERLLIGEIYLPLDKLVTYYGKEGAGVHLPFNFQLIKVKWNAESIYALINDYEGSLPPGGWPNWVLGNHDKPRIASRVGAQQARLAAVLLLSLRGTPTLYYGDELGMQDVEIPPERIQDPKEKTMPGYSRDPERTPMQWNSGKYAGFSAVAPWLPLETDYRSRNVESQQVEKGSMLRLYKKLIAFRQNSMVLQLGDFVPLGLYNQLIVFKRKWREEEILVAVNFDKAPATYEPDFELSGQLVISTSGTGEQGKVKNKLKLEAEEAVVVQLTGVEGAV